MTIFESLPIFVCPAALLLLALWRVVEWAANRPRAERPARPVDQVQRVPRTSETAGNRVVQRWQRESDVSRYIEKIGG